MREVEKFRVFAALFVLALVLLLGQAQGQTVKTYSCSVNSVNDNLGNVNGYEVITTYVYNELHLSNLSNRAAMFRPEEKRKAKKFCFKWLDKLDKRDEKKRKKGVR